MLYCIIFDYASEVRTAVKIFEAQNIIKDVDFKILPAKSKAEKCKITANWRAFPIHEQMVIFKDQDVRNYAEFIFKCFEGEVQKPNWGEDA